MKLMLNSSAIKHQTEKALLIKLPGIELYFWHPKRFCRQFGENNHLISLWFANSNWEIKAEHRDEKTNAVLKTLTACVGSIAKTYNIAVKD